MHPSKMLVIYYSFSGQTRSVIQRLIAGMEEQGVLVVTERLSPMQTLRFPIGSVGSTVRMMLVTLLRKKMEIEPLSENCYASYDGIILAGPTWSYNPSGPVLALLHEYGEKLFAGSVVLPLISCRGYWRMHWYGLRRLLMKKRAIVPNVIVFTHPTKEPWRTIGVFLKLAGKTPERSLGERYPRYGHSREQQEQAHLYGLRLGEALQSGQPLDTLNFPIC
jgi:hypothetical protein